MCIYCGLLKLSVLSKKLHYLNIVFCFMLVVSCKAFMCLIYLTSYSVKTQKFCTKWHQCFNVFGSQM